MIADHTQQLVSFTTRSIDIQSTVFTIFVLLLALLFAHHFLLVKSNPHAPPLVKSWFPFIGVGFQFLRDPERVLLQCRARYGDIYTLYMGGKRLHVVCDVFSGIPEIYKNNKVFSISALTKSFGSFVIGMPEKMFEDDRLERAVAGMFGPLFLAPDRVEQFVHHFSNSLRPILARETKNLDCDGMLAHDGVVVNLDKWLRRIMFECVGKTLFGETWPSDDDFFNDYLVWDEGGYSLMKRYPSFLTSKIIAARERYYKRILDTLKQPLVRPSEIVQERLKVSNEHSTMF